jgi:signal transduction histidine kinase
LPTEDLRVLVFQLVRELLFNVVKHAQVNRASIAFREQENRLFLRVEDQGIGFNVDAVTKAEGEEKGSLFGLYGIRERLALFGGSLVIDSTPGAGTRIEISLPKQVEGYTIRGLFDDT